MQSGHGTVRVFINSQEKNVEDRSNLLYDKHITHLSEVIQLKNDNEQNFLFVFFFSEKPN